MPAGTYLLGSQCDITTSRHLLTPVEHAQLLQEGIDLSGPALAHDDHLHINAQTQLSNTVRTVLTGEIFD